MTAYDAPSLNGFTGGNNQSAITDFVGGKKMQGSIIGKRVVSLALLLSLAFAVVQTPARSADSATPPDWDTIRKQIEQLTKDNQDLKDRLKPIDSKVENIVDSKYGPNANVTTKDGKLTITGIVQVWYYAMEHDHNALFQDASINDIRDTNEATDNDSFRIRRTELRFHIDLSEDLSGEVMFDPAREAQSYPAFPANQANSSIFKRGINTNVANVQGGVGSAPRLLQDAFIVYKGFIPHHDFKIGQFKPVIGEEGIRSTGQLDFAERSFIGQLDDFRDEGITAHGEWWDADGKGAGRFQYWVGAVNGAGNYHGSGGQ